MIVKYNNNILMNRIVPDIDSAKSRISTSQMYNIKSICPKDFKYKGLLNQVLDELYSDVNRLNSLSNNITTKDQRIISIDRNVKNYLGSNRIETVSPQKRKI